MIKIGIVGAGWAGYIHTEVYKQFPDIKVVGIADIKGERAKALADKTGTIPFYSIDSFLSRPDITIIDVCVPTYLHKEYVLKAAELGKDIICEDPVALTVQDADEMIKKCTEKNVRFMIGDLMRFWPEYSLLKKIYDTGRLGKLLSITFTRLSSRPTLSADNWVLNNEYSGGPLIDLHIHDTDFLLYLTGKKPEKVYTSGRKTDTLYEHVWTTYKFSDGVVANAECGWNFPGNYPPVTTYTGIFEKAVIEYNSRNKPALIIYHADGKTDRPLIETKTVQTPEGNTINLGGYFYKLRYLIEHTIANKPFQVVNSENVLASLQVVLKEKESADTGKEIVV
ncbi:MAG: Gfo/Idh/MocA family oxidoreductase [Candidatus Omnitrophica bacterium]|nr:Gfo/Idh/MocA family oxidoreductase [Candidatus Omnitrophota bacterium]